MKIPTIALCLAPSLAALGCATQTSVDPAGLRLAAPVRLEPTRAWSVIDSGAVAGFVIEFDEVDARREAPRNFFSVRNAWQQDVGAIDGLGRAWRFEVHAAEPRWIGTGTVLDGAREILGASADTALTEIRIDLLLPEPAAPASAGPLPTRDPTPGADRQRS